MDGINTLRPRVPGGIIAAGCVFFWLPKDPLQRFPQGPHGAVLPASPYQGVDEGFDGVIDASKQEKQHGVAELWRKFQRLRERMMRRERKITMWSL